MTPTGLELTVRIPMRLKVLPNMRTSRFAHARVVKSTRTIVGLELLAQARPFLREWQKLSSNPRLCLQVLQVRNGPNRLDDDNCTGAFKPVRDEVARFFGIDDGSNRWRWLPCEQQRGPYAVRVHISVVTAPLSAHGLTPVEFWEQVNRERAAPKSKSLKSRITPNVRKPR